MTKLYNPALSQEPRDQAMKTIPPLLRETLLGWLERSGRLLASDLDEVQDRKMSEGLDDILDPELYSVEEEEESEDEQLE